MSILKVNSFSLPCLVIWAAGFVLFSASLQAAEFSLNVVSGFGSGDHESGTEVFIEAYPYDDVDPDRSGHEPDDIGGSIRLFDRWTGNTQAVANIFSASTSLIMPSSPVSLVATFKDGFRWAPPQIISEIPSDHSGVIFMFHGAGGNARNMFANDEIRLFVQEALIRGLGIVALDSYDRYGKRWQESPDPAQNLDLQRAASARQYLIADGQMSALDPVYVIGISNGGLAASLFDQNTQQALDFPVDAAALFISSGNLSVMETTTVPTIFALAENDDVNIPAMWAFDSLVTNGTPAQFWINPSRPLYPGSFWRIEGFALADSEIVYDTLFINGFIDDSGYVLESPKTSGWELFVPAAYSDFILPVGEQLKRAYGAHTFFSDLNKEVLDFLENPSAELDLIPIVTGFDPESAVPGAFVNIDGDNFIGIQSVSFGGISADFVMSGSQIRANVPVEATTGPIAVTNSAGTGTSTQNFVVEGPTIDSLDPAAGPVGTSVTILGSGFVSIDSVSFGAVPADFTMFSSGQIRATVPPGAVTGAVTVSNNIGSGVSSGDFVVDGPIVDSIDPSSGPPGTIVTISGSGFVLVDTVTFGGLPAEFTEISGGQIRATVPVGAVTGTIAVSNYLGSGVSSGDFVVDGPIIDSIDPSSGPPGTSVTILGTGFVSVDTVSFGGIPADFTVFSSGQIRATVPVGAVTGAVTVSNNIGSGVSSGDFVVDGPMIDSLAPSSGPPGTSVTILGTGFVSVDTVSFGGIPADFTVFSSSQIRATVPVGAVTGAVTVSNNIGTGSSPAPFVVEGPEVTAFSPTSGSVNTRITITGSGFNDLTSVKLGGITMQVFFSNSNKIWTKIPSGATTGVFEITTGSGSATSSAAFVVTP